MCLLLYLYLYLSLYHLYFLHCKCISIFICWFKNSYTYITCFAIICLYNLHQLIHLILWWNISWCSKSLLDIALKCSEDLIAFQKSSAFFGHSCAVGPSKSNHLWAQSRPTRLSDCFMIIDTIWNWMMMLRKKTAGLRPGGSLNSSHFQWRSCTHPSPARCRVRG